MTYGDSRKFFPNLRESPQVIFQPTGAARRSLPNPGDELSQPFVEGVYLQNCIHPFRNVQNCIHPVGPWLGEPKLSEHAIY